MIDAPFEQYERLLADDEEAAFQAEHAKRMKAWNAFVAISAQQHAQRYEAYRLLRERGIR